MQQSSEKDSEKTKTDTPEVRQKDTDTKTDIIKIVDGQTLRTDSFGRNLSAEQVYKRAERISAALFLITSHIKDTEPVKTSIREMSIMVLEEAISVRASLRSEASPEVRVMKGSLRQLISLVRMLGVAGYVSLQNIHALIEAIDDLGALLSSAFKSSLSDDVIIARDDLVPAVSSVKQPNARPAQSRAGKLLVKGESPAPRGKVIKDTPMPVPDSSGTRGDRIMDILRSSGAMGIKDISINLPEYSEKMIQRELADLVAAGRVQKAGEKRWSRYSVVQ